MIEVITRVPVRKNLDERPDFHSRLPDSGEVFWLVSAV